MHAGAQIELTLDPTIFGLWRPALAHYIVTAFLWHLVPTDPMLTDCQDHARLLARSMTYADHRVTVNCARHKNFMAGLEEVGAVQFHKVPYQFQCAQF